MIHLKPLQHPYGIRMGNLLRDGLVLYLPCWEGSGNVAKDVAGSRHNATFAANTAWRIGKVGSGLNFPAASDYCTISHSNDFILDDFTVAILVNLSTVDINKRCIYHYDAASTDGFFIGPHDTGAGTLRFIVFVGGNSVTVESNAGVSSSDVQLVVGRRASGLAHIFVDGILQTASDTLAGQIDSSDPIYLGNDREFNNGYAGGMDMVGLWNIALLDSQIEELAADPFSLIQPPPNRLITWGAIQNAAPVVDDQTFSIAENSANGTAVGTVIATDADNDTLTYAITAGNTNSAFAIDSGNGKITVNDENELDFETTPQYLLTVKVTDDGYGARSDTATITINVTDVVEGETTNELLLKGYGT